MTTLPCFVGDADPLLARVPGTDLHMYGTLWLLTQGETRKTKRVRLFTEFVSRRLAAYAPLLAGLSFARLMSGRSPTRAPAGSSSPRQTRKTAGTKPFPDGPCPQSPIPCVRPTVPLRPSATWAASIPNVRFTSILLKNPLLWRPHFGFVALSARQIPASSPHRAKAGAGRGMSFASFRRFWAVAAKRNSSLAPFGPRRRNRPSLRMRFR